MNPYCVPGKMRGSLQLFYDKILTTVPWNVYSYLLHVTLEETESGNWSNFSRTHGWLMTEPWTRNLWYWCFEKPCPLPKAIASRDSDVICLCWAQALIFQSSTESWQNYGRFYLVCCESQAWSSLGIGGWEEKEGFTDPNVIITCKAFIAPSSDTALVTITAMYVGYLVGEASFLLPS